MQIQPEKGPLQPQPSNPVARSAPPRGDGGPFRGQAEGGAPGASLLGIPELVHPAAGAFRVLTVKWGLFGPSMGQFFVLSGVSVFRLLLDVLFPWARVG